MKYTGPKEKISRRLGVNLMLKPVRSASQKSAFLRKPYPPGLHGRRRRRGLSDYGQQLAEKQKVRYTYGLTERQFLRYFKEAKRKLGDTSIKLLEKLERRFDNVIFRLGLASSRAAARQLVGHGHFTVNGRRVSIPSYEVKVGDQIKVGESSAKLGPFKGVRAALKNYTPPQWLELNKETLEAKVKFLPAQDDLISPFNMQYIVEFYSR